MNSLIFARVSSKDQEDGHSLDAQIQSCFEYAIKKGFKVIEQFRVVESCCKSGLSRLLNLWGAMFSGMIELCGL